MQPPQIIEKPAMTLVGLEKPFIHALSPETNNFKVIPPLWDQFAKRAGEVTDKLAEMGAAAMIDWLDDPARYPLVAQSDARVTYAAKIDKAEARIHWTESAIEIERQVRAFAPRPGAWAMVAGERVKILAAEVVAQSGSAGQVLDDRMTIACGADAIRPLSVQRSGRAEMTPEELQRGFKVPVGGHLT